MSQKHSFKDGDVVKYCPSQHHCREGMAICSKGILLDTFWGGSQPTELSENEFQGSELVFNLSDYEPAKEYEWSTRHPDDRGLVTHQHGLQKDYYLRKGSKRDLSTVIKNAEGALEVAFGKLRSAENEVRWRKEQLEELRSESLNNKN